MFCCKNNQTSQPLYDYYVETDLDCLDQPIDFSKKYSDQESYEHCRQAKSNSKPTEFSPPAESQAIKQSCNDELKVYCIEGTPLTISSASSFCDLREVGTSVLQKPVMKRNFPSVNDDENSQEAFEIKKELESSDKINSDLPIEEKDEINKEVKSVSFRNGDDISKASSPLMFSRSSSICSLNSLEQQSIIDDRSSVSAFSTLTSGMISPSDLPDSPGAVMSPVLTDKANSPKIDSSKADSDIESENLDEFVSKKTDEEEILENERKLPHNLKSSQEYTAVRYEDNTVDLEDDVITHHHTFEISNDSAAELDEVFTDTAYKKKSYTFKIEMNVHTRLSIKSVDDSDDDDDDDDILLQQCIQLGMPDKEMDNKSDEDNVHYQAPQNIQSEYTEKIDNANKSDDDSGDDDILLQRCIQLGMPQNVTKPAEEASSKLIDDSKYSHPLSHTAENIETKINEPDKLDDDSDGDDNILLQRCIQLGMPQEKPETVKLDTKSVNSKYTHSPSHSCKNVEMKKTDPCKSGDGLYEDNKIVLQQSMPFEIPYKTSDAAKPNTKLVVSPVFAKTVSPNIRNMEGKFSDQDKFDDDPDGDNNILLQQCIQLGLPQKVAKAIGGGAKLPNSKYSHSPSHMVQNVSKKAYPVKSEANSYLDEGKIPVQHHMQLRTPKEACNTKLMHPRVFSKPEYTTQLNNYYPAKGLRDGCPDGISDGSDEDILTKCIRTGMPSPKVNIHKRLPSSSTQNISQKLQIHNCSYMAESATDPNKKFLSSRLPQTQPYAPIHSSTTWLSNSCFIDVDSMRIYRTEDTPILSPSASISDLSSLSFNEDKSCHESFLNNSRNSDCSSESDDDELLLQCIRSGMPEAKKAVV